MVQTSNFEREVGESPDEFLLRNDNQHFYTLCAKTGAMVSTMYWHNDASWTAYFSAHTAARMTYIAIREWLYKNELINDAQNEELLKWIEPFVED